MSKFMTKYITSGVCPSKGRIWPVRIVLLDEEGDEMPVTDRLEVSI